MTDSIADSKVVDGFLEFATTEYKQVPAVRRTITESCDKFFKNEAMRP